MRTKGKNINIDGDPPATVEEMKDGELRVGEGGFFGRVGNQILQKDWPVTLLYDDFEDGIIDPVWQFTYEKGGGVAVEENGNFVLTPVASGSGSRIFAKQIDIVLISQGVWVPGEFYFDIWGKLTMPASSPADHNSTIRLYFFDGGHAQKDYVGFYIAHNAGNFHFYINYGDGTGGGAQSPVELGVTAAGANEFWWRYRFLPGDAKVRSFYRYSNSPHSRGWIEVTSLYGQDPIPTGNVFMNLHLRVENHDGASPHSFYFNEIANWVGEEITTTTTTTTTTT